MTLPPPGLLGDLQRARAAVLEAELADRPGERYLAAQAAALRVAAIILSVRTHPGLAARRTGPRDAWLTVAEVAPELQEWAGLFAATAGKREAVRAGATSIVSSREADELVQDVAAFLAVVEQAVRRAQELFALGSQADEPRSGSHLRTGDGHGGAATPEIGLADLPARAPGQPAGQAGAG